MTMVRPLNVGQRVSGRPSQHPKSVAMVLGNCNRDVANAVQGWVSPEAHPKVPS